MPSDWEVLCDAIVTELTTNVPAISGSNVPVLHRYTAQDPEELQADPGERHLAVWPFPAETETVRPLVTMPGGDVLTQRYAIMVWEHVGAQGEQGQVDEVAAKVFLQLHNDIRGRFYVKANMKLGSPTVPVTESRYAGSIYGERAGLVRWFALTVLVDRTIDVT